VNLACDVGQGMTLDLGQGRSITVNTFHGKIWINVSANGGGTSVALNEKDALAVSAAITASILVERKRLSGRS
jgi:hypothetical protein